MIFLRGADEMILLPCGQFPGEQAGIVVEETGL